MASITFTIVDSRSEEPVSPRTTGDNVTIRQLLDLEGVNLETMNVTYRVNGQVEEFDLDDIIQNGARISITPEKVKGA